MRVSTKFDERTTRALPMCLMLCIPHFSIAQTVTIDPQNKNVGTLDSGLKFGTQKTAVTQLSLATAPAYISYMCRSFD
jgi:hypothetical protein